MPVCETNVSSSDPSRGAADGRPVDPKQVAGAVGDGIENLLNREPVRDRLFDAVEAIEKALPFSKPVEKPAVLLGVVRDQTG